MSVSCTIRYIFEMKERNVCVIVFERKENGDPMVGLHGQHNLVVLLERNVLHHRVDSFIIVLINSSSFVDLDWWHINKK